MYKIKCLTVNSEELSQEETDENRGQNDHDDGDPMGILRNILRQIWNHVINNMELKSLY